jgi:hypothetical protein
MVGIQNKILKDILLNGSFNGIIEWKNSEQIKCDTDWTINEFIVLCDDAEEFKTSQIKHYHDIKEQITNCTTVDEVKNITW